MYPMPPRALDTVVRSRLRRAVWVNMYTVPPLLRALYTHNTLPPVAINRHALITTFLVRSVLVVGKRIISRSAMVGGFVFASTVGGYGDEFRTAMPDVRAACQRTGSLSGV